MQYKVRKFNLFEIFFSSEKIDFLCFSLEGVGGIIQWGFWDQLHSLPCAGIATGDDVHANEAGLAYQNIYNEFVRTKTILDPVLLKQDEAIFEFRSFKGTYKVSLVDDKGEDVRILLDNLKVEDNVVISI